jgi:hypothetical protein
VGFSVAVGVGLGFGLGVGVGVGVGVGDAVTVAVTVAVALADGVEESDFTPQPAASSSAAPNPTAHRCPTDAPTPPPLRGIAPAPI